MRLSRIFVDLLRLIIVNQLVWVGKKWCTMFVGWPVSSPYPQAYSQQTIFPNYQTNTSPDRNGRASSVNVLLKPLKTIALQITHQLA